MAPISGSTDGEETKTEEAKWRRGQSWNPNYSIIAPKSGPDSIYPVPPFSSSSSSFLSGNVLTIETLPEEAISSKFLSQEFFLGTYHFMTR